MAGAGEDDDEVAPPRPPPLAQQSMDDAAVEQQHGVGYESSSQMENLPGGLAHFEHEGQEIPIVLHGCSKLEKATITPDIWRFSRLASKLFST